MVDSEARQGVLEIGDQALEKTAASGRSLGGDVTTKTQEDYGTRGIVWSVPGGVFFGRNLAGIFHS